MTINDGVAPLTVGNVTVWPTPVTGNYDSNGVWPGNGSLTIANYCAGNTHVWACDHAEKCKCGKVTRQPEPKLCPGCGKSHV